MNKMFCKECYEVAVPKTVTPGYFIIELVAWCFMVLPGLLYTMYRISNKKKVCAHCGSESVIKADSFLAKKMMTDANMKVA